MKFETFAVLILRLPVLKYSRPQNFKIRNRSDIGYLAFNYCNPSISSKIKVFEPLPDLVRNFWAREKLLKYTGTFVFVFIAQFFCEQIEQILVGVDVDVVL